MNLKDCNKKLRWACGTVHRLNETTYGVDIPNMSDEVPGFYAEFKMEPKGEACELIDNCYPVLESDFAYDLWYAVDRCHELSEQAAVVGLADNDMSLVQVAITDLHVALLKDIVRTTRKVLKLAAMEGQEGGPTEAGY